MENIKRICYLCGEEMIKNENTSLESKWGKYDVIIKGVTGYKCPNCEEEIYDREETVMIQSLSKALAEANIKEKPDVLNISQTADLLKVSNQTVYNMVKDGRLKAFKIGREWRFMKKDILSLLNPEHHMQAARGNISRHDEDTINEELKKM